MSNPKLPIDISIQGIRDFAASMRSQAKLFEDIAAAMEQNGLDELKAVFYYPSGEDGMKKLMSFANGLNTAFGLQLANRSFEAVKESQKNYEQASKTAGKIQEKAENELKTVRKKKTM